MKSSPRSRQLEEARTQQRRPNAAKNINKKIKKQTKKQTKKTAEKQRARSGEWLIWRCD